MQKPRSGFCNELKGACLAVAAGDEVDNKPGRRVRLPIWGIVVIVAVLAPCLALTLLLLVVDQAAIEATVYVNAMSSGNAGLAELLGDHYTSDSGWHQRFYRQDIERDIGWLSGKEVSQVGTSREQTLSGQWATVVRFKWRQPGTNQAWKDAALRVKTDSWWLLTYVRAVELLEP